MSARTTAGFTLIELMIAIAVFGILMMAALPNFRIWIQNTQIRTVAEGMLNGLQLARAEAVRRNTKTELQVSTTTIWTLRVVATSELIQRRVATEGTGNAVMTIKPTGATRVSFDGMGRVTSNADGTPSVTEMKIDSSAIAAADSRELCVIVTTAGLVKLCDPSVPSTDTRACPVKTPAYCS